MLLDFFRDIKSRYIASPPPGFTKIEVFFIILVYYYSFAPFRQKNYEKFQEVKCAIKRLKISQNPQNIQNKYQLKTLGL